MSDPNLKSPAPYGSTSQTPTTTVTESDKGKTSKTPNALETDKGKTSKNSGKTSKNSNVHDTSKGKTSKASTTHDSERGKKSKTPTPHHDEKLSKTPVLAPITPRDGYATPRDKDFHRTNTRETRGTVGTKPVSSRNTTPMSQRSWVTYNSPLWVKEKMKTDGELSQSMPTTPRVLSRMEGGFVNDAIVTHVKMTRRNPIIPQYDAISDKYAQAYFQSPFVQGIVERNRNIAHLKEMKARTINKLSVRRRCKPTPDVTKIRERETAFVNDAIITEKKRTKYKDIIPPYNAAGDKLCKAYFKREDIKRLVDTTCGPNQNTQSNSMKEQQTGVKT